MMKDVQYIVSPLVLDTCRTVQTSEAVCLNIDYFLSFFDRTVYIHGFNKMDFTLWHSAIMLAAGTDGKALSNQQLTKNGVPIIVDSCIAFVTQYGELCGTYQTMMLEILHMMCFKEH